jgi:RNA exonuclease 4
MKRMYQSLMDWEISADRVVAMDCEMVGVGEDGVRSILARISLVDFYGNLLLDTFVKPTEPVTNYRTFVSGVRPHNLNSPAAMEFQVCRSLVQRFLLDKILVGHGLNNDLEVLRLTHQWYHLRDSATYGPFLKPGCRPKRLKELAAEELGISIQREGDEHCSLEDARAVMMLYRNKQREWDDAITAQRNFVLHCPLRDLSPRPVLLIDIR